ncbi:MAG: hypothetical protein ABIS86_21255 [Streptosporangiaceae bacterium]
MADKKISPVGQAAAALRAALERQPGVVAYPNAALTFEALRAKGDRGQLFVSLRQNGRGEVEFLAAPERAEPYTGTCIVLGTSTQIPHVAAVVRQRVAR